MSKDGITTQELAIEKVDGIFDSIQMDVRPDSTLPLIVRACGILKNLDDYQYIVCSEVRGLPDSNPYKKILQKYRVAIVARICKVYYDYSFKTNDRTTGMDSFCPVIIGSPL